MSKKAIGWLYLYLFAGIADLVAIAKGLQEYRFFTKPLIIVSLGLFFYFTTQSIQKSLLRKAVLAGLLFSMIGDFLLLFPDLFSYGLGAFLVTLICYIIVFKLTQNHQVNLRSVNFLKIFFYNLPIYLITAIVYFLINDHLYSLKIPVIIYMLTMALMVIIARERFQRTNIQSFIQILAGAFLFMISDSLLALDIFFQPIENGGVLIMGTYIMAQLLIIMGIRSHLIHSPGK
ncbi:lysoplasmalogenase [Echinicola pacifica]|nr:lysoplasmalogenase [Echinicola pacifica]